MVTGRILVTCTVALARYRLNITYINPHQFLQNSSFVELENGLMINMVMVINIYPQICPG